MKPYIIYTLIIFAMLAGGCAASRTSKFVHPEFDFSQVERVAVVPFENLSTEQGTANYVTRVVMTELLATGAFDIVEPGEVNRVLESIGQSRPAELSLDKLKALGEQLSVQCVIFGSVGESSTLRSSSISTHVISLDMRMTECATGTTVWSANTNTVGPGAIARLFGAGETTRGEAIHNAARRAVKALVK